MNKESEKFYFDLLKQSKTTVKLSDKLNKFRKLSNEYVFEKVQNALDMADESFQQALEKVDESSLKDVRKICKIVSKSLKEMFGKNPYQSTLKYRSLQNLDTSAKMELEHRVNVKSLSK